MRGLISMKRLKLARIVSISLIAFSCLMLNPKAVQAEWKQDSTGWWYTEGSSYAKGWKLIDKNWYYFYSNGYMAQDTVIDGYYLNSSGAWTNSINDLVEDAILKNVSAENTTFTIQCSNSYISVDNLEQIIKSEINKLKILYPYEIYNVINYQMEILSYTSGSIDVNVTCNYRMTAEMANDLDVKVKNIVLSIAPDTMSQSEKELAIHDWIVNNTKYDQTYTIYDPYNTLIKHTGVCQGYALLAQKMFTAAGIKSTIVGGTAGGQDHAWNMVYIDSKWRHVDCTWDDPVSSQDILSHEYYNLTDQQMSVDHTWDTSAYPKTN